MISFEDHFDYYYSRMLLDHDADQHEKKDLYKNCYSDCEDPKYEYYYYYYYDYEDLMMMLLHHHSHQHEDRTQW